LTILLDATLVLLILTNLRLLGSSRLHVCIRTVAWQAVLLGLLPVLSQWGSITVRVAFLGLITTALKAGVMPWLLHKAVRDAHVLREVEPILGFTSSLLAGMGLLGLSVYLGAQLPLPGKAAATFLVPVSLFTMMVGLLVIVSRVKAVSQVLGYLTMENGIYAFGMAFAIEEPLLVEMGVLLDVFAAVFIMGIMIQHISRTFDHIDTDRLSTLRD
jgi:hydrogenase-4 component E